MGSVRYVSHETACPCDFPAGYRLNAVLLSRIFAYPDCPKGRRATGFELLCQHALIRNSRHIRRRAARGSTPLCTLAVPLLGNAVEFRHDAIQFQHLFGDGVGDLRRNGGLVVSG